MFPDTRLLQDGAPKQGKVFCISTTSTGGLSGPYREIKTDVSEWDDCQRCPEFGSCYKLCLAKLALESAISAR
jgi:hypothetical protein